MSFDCMHFACFSFFFCIHIEKHVSRNWAKSSYESLRLDEQTREPVCLKNRRINVTLLKKFLQFTKSVATMSV